jgi:hypothetical protein
MAKHTCHFDNVVALHSTELALQCKFDDRDEPVWIPQSHIDDDSEVWRKGDEGTLIITEWIATKKGLI